MNPDDGKVRCPWCLGQFPEYVRYHDEEWGIPVHDDRIHFEFLILEGAQAGLSWATILKRRAGYRAAFADFDPERVAAFGEASIAALIADPRIIRNRAKIRAAVSNARLFLELQREHGSFDAYIWSFVGNQPIVRRPRTLAEIPATSPESDRLAADLRKRGFRFAGSTIMYAHMQACGLVDDHLAICFRAGRQRVPGDGSTLKELIE
jgi:DNA-3-methyladenine glycosylase I